MTPDIHPTYQNPTVQEAICEIVFSLQDGAVWNPLWYSEFFKRVQEDFPNFQPIDPMGAGIGPFVLPFTPPSQIVRYFSADNQRLLQLSANSLVIILLPKYPGWGAFTQQIQSAWDSCVRVVDPSKVSQIGIRYVNRMERTRPNQPLGDWLKATDYIPQGVLLSLPGFASVLQTRIDEVNRLSVSVGEMPITGSLEQAAFLFDIDRIVQKDIARDTNSVISEANRLHGHVWEVFDTAVSERLKRLLNGELV